MQVILMGLPNPLELEIMAGVVTQAGILVVEGMVRTQGEEDMDRDLVEEGMARVQPTGRRIQR